jgi:hypothetical protein
MARTTDAVSRSPGDLVATVLRTLLRVLLVLAGLALIAVLIEALGVDSPTEASEYAVLGAFGLLGLATIGLAALRHDRVYHVVLGVLALILSLAATWLIIIAIASD